MRFSAVIFDLDGTLLDSLADLAGAVNAALEAAGLPTHPREAYTRFIGDGVQTLVRRAAPGTAEGEPLERLVEAVRAAYAARWDRESRPFPGVGPMLDALGAAGVRLAMLSNKPDEFTALAAARFFAPWPFAVARGARPGVPLKPDPAAALAVARDLGLDPGAVLFAGDSDVDMKTARGAGMFAAGALWGFRGEAELRAAGAQALFASPEELGRFVLGG